MCSTSTYVERAYHGYPAQGREQCHRKGKVDDTGAHEVKIEYISMTEEEENLAFTGRYSSSSNSIEPPLPEEREEELKEATLATTEDVLVVEASESEVNNDEKREEEPQVIKNDIPAAGTRKEAKGEGEMEQLGGVLYFPSDTHTRVGYYYYTIEQWNGWKDKKIFYTGKLTLISKILWGVTFSYDDSYRIAIYQRPAIILILKQQPPSLFGGNKQPPILLVEAMLDPAVCKLKLSHWTTPSSIYYSKQPQPGLHQSCFELVTPTHTWTFSVLPPFLLKPTPLEHDKDALKYDQDRWIRDTCMWEAMLSQSLLQLHVTALTSSSTQNIISPNKIIKDCYSWRHAVILGTLHSYVVTSDKEMLQLAISQTPKVNINEIDEYGFTPLHYACNQRDCAAVSFLVKAGADATIPLVNKEYLLSSTCCHISAANLDYKSLSILLSSTHDPNVLDEYGRTPMYVAAMEGVTVDPSNPLSNLNCLDMTLRTLHECGGHYLVDDDHSSTMRHPVCMLSSRWQATKLSMVLSYDPPPSSASLGPLYHYPLHLALLSLRQKIAAEISSIFSSTKEQYQQNQQQEQDDPIKISTTTTAKHHSLFASASPRKEEEDCNIDLAGTLRALLNHGLEPNERCCFLSLDDELCVQYHGCTPIQILAICALDVDDAIQRSNVSEEHRMLLENFLEQIAFATEVLAYCGARIHNIIEPPPNQQQGMLLGSSAAELDAVASTWRTLGEYSIEYLLNLLGGKERLVAAWTSWTIKGSIPASSQMVLRSKPTSDDCTSIACAVCWKTFGKLRCRKHWCRSCHKYVCEDCSTKRIVKFGEELRVSDGQYLLASFMNAKQTAADGSKLRACNNSNAPLSLANSKKSSSLRSSSAEEVEKEREELFGGFTSMGKMMMNYLTGVDQDEEDTLSGLTETLGQTKDALHERGAKLSRLSEKTSALADASKDFAAMARALKESQQKANSGFFW